MATKRIRLVWLSPLVAAAIGYAVGSHRQAPQSAPTQAGDAAAARPASRPPAREPARAVRMQASSDDLRPMPAAGLPVSESFDALAERARAGDARASLRLLRELSLCEARPGLQRDARTRDYRRPFVQGDAAAQRRQQELEERDERRRARASERYATAQALCGDVTDAEMATLGEWLERAADSGDPGAALCYVMAAASDDYAPPRYSDAWVEWMKDYRARAFDYAERAFAGGYASASLYLYDVAAGQYAFPAFQLDRDRPPDFARAYALAWFEASMIERKGAAGDPVEYESWRDSAATIGADLDPAEIAQARRWADAQAQRMSENAAPDPPCELSGAL